MSPVSSQSPAPTTSPRVNSGVHPSAVGSNTQPITRNSASMDSVNSSQTASGASNDLDSEGYPPQRHAGAVGIGPNYGQGTGIGDKLAGFKDEVKGKVTRNPDLVQHGREQRTGELKRKEQERDDKEDPFTTASDQNVSATERGAKEQAATVAPEGTGDAETQRQGENTEGMRTISGH